MYESAHFFLLLGSLDFDDYFFICSFEAGTQSGLLYFLFYFFYPFATPFTPKRSGLPDFSRFSVSREFFRSVVGKAGVILSVTYVFCLYCMVSVSLVPDLFISIVKTVISLIYL